MCRTVTILFIWALVSTFFAAGTLIWVITMQRKDIRTLREENERLLSRVGYEYGLARDRPTPSWMSPTPDASVDELSPTSTYFTMKNRT